MKKTIELTEALKEWREATIKVIDKMIERNQSILPEKCEYCDNFATEVIAEAESPDDFINVRVCKNHADSIKNKNQ